MNCPNCTWKIYFNPLRPRGRRLASSMSFIPIASVFQPTPPARTETPKNSGPVHLWQFQPTPPARTETTIHKISPNGIRNFNPLRPRGRRRPPGNKNAVKTGISTHSAREDGDCMNCPNCTWKIYFNPLRPRGRRHLMLSGPPHFLQFQPTPPARTETISIQRWNNLLIISTHSAREDGDYSKVHLYAQKMISTHSAREDGD